MAIAEIVVKLGGEIVGKPTLDSIARDLQQLIGEGRRLVVTHGGGPQATALAQRLGQVPKIVAGRRVTDEGTLEIMKMTVADQVNVDLCARLRANGLRPIGLHDVVRATRRPARKISGAA